MEFTVEKAGDRLDKFLAAQDKTHSRSVWQKMIERGAIKINGKVITKSSVSLRANDQIVIDEATFTSEDGILPEAEPDIPLKVIYEDKGIVVVNKQAHLLTHPTKSEPRHTLVNALLARYPEMKGVGENPMRPGIVHRLDKDTSGIIVAARTQEAFMKLKEQFISRTVRKTYLALVEGIPEKKEGTIDFAIRPTRANRLKKTIVKGREADKKSERAAVTNYRVTETFEEKYALLEVEPKTGRTHQIRVHLKAIGHPVVGDQLYGSKSKLLNRQFLHAAKLEFTAPSGKHLSLEAEMPEDLSSVLEELRRNNPS